MSTNVVTSVIRSYTVDTAFISGEPMGDYYETAIRKGEHSWTVVNNSWTELTGALDVHNEWIKTILLNFYFIFTSFVFCIHHFVKVLYIYY